MNDDIDLIEDDDDGYVDDGTLDMEDEESPLTDLAELQRRVGLLVSLRAERDRTNEAAKKAKDEFEKFQAELIAAYKASPLKKSVNVELPDGGTIQLVPRSTHFGRILNREEAEAYFRERNKVQEYVKEDFRMGRLHELVREHIEQKKPLPPGIDFYTKEYFTITFKD